MSDNEPVAQIAKAIQVKTGGNVEGKLPDWWSEFIGMVLAELQSAGRLIPAGGMALTAEQAEDVRTAREGLRGYRNFDGNARGRVNRLIAAVDALFPATEPAEVDHPNHVCDLGCRVDCLFNGTRSGAPAEPAEEERGLPYCRAPEDGWECTEPAGHDGRHVATNRKNGSVYHSWPAEEETKAEGPWIVQLPEGMTMEQWIESLPDEAPGFLAAVREVRERLGISSPVVPAPTETGPWQDISEAPKHLTLIDRVGDKWTYDGDNWITPETAILPVLYINRKYAPFVAAEGAK